jgi:ATP-binding cassette subfamily F protein 3
MADPKKAADFATLRAKLEPIADVIEDRVYPFHFPNPEKPLAPPLVRWDHASVGYTEGKPILRNITLRLDPDDRIALLGSNGNGKSTFAKLLCGKLKAMSGEMKHPPRLTVGYFAQHQLDELSPERTPYDYFTDLMPENTQAQRRARLGSYGFGASLADSKCKTLSGGEKARLLFALAAFHAPHILVLDEPTNHLDVDSREALIHAINDYEGAVILISHDRHIIETSADRLWLVANGTVKPFDGDMDDYTDFILGRTPQKREASPPPVPVKQAPPVVRATPATVKKLIQEITVKMSKLQEKIDVLDRALQDNQLYMADPKKAADFATLRAKLARDLEEQETQWLEAQERLEQTA